MSVLHVLQGQIGRVDSISNQLYLSEGQLVAFNKASVNFVDSSLHIVF